MGYLTNPKEAPNTNKQFTSDNEYSGIAGAQEDGKPMSYEDIYKFKTNNKHYNQLNLRKTHYQDVLWRKRRETLRSRWLIRW